MTKRVLTSLAGLGLIALGVLLFVAPSRAYALQALTQCWPLFLALAGVVRVVGFLLDHEPRSPMGGVMLAAVGGILLAFNLSHNLAHEFDDDAAGGALLLALVARYWFWVLLAFVVGRVLRQYGAQAESMRGRQAPRAFSFGAVCLMLLITAAGLAASYAERHQAQTLHAAFEDSHGSQ